MHVQFLFFVLKGVRMCRNYSYGVSSPFKRNLTHARSVFSSCLIHTNKSLLCTPTHLITHIN